jgi:hypothetical protein
MSSLCKITDVTKQGGKKGRLGPVIGKIVGHDHVLQQYSGIRRRKLKDFATWNTVLTLPFSKL